MKITILSHNIEQCCDGSLYWLFYNGKYAFCSNLKCKITATEFIRNRNQIAAQYSQ